VKVAREFARTRPSEIPPTWRRWRRARIRALVRTGLPKGTAQRMAMAEATARAHLELLFGFETATALDVAIGIRPDGSAGVLVGGSLEDVPEAARPLLVAMTPEAAFDLR
jgi:hypothetical protein